MRRELKEAFEEARPYLQKSEELLNLINLNPSEEELERKVRELEGKDPILATDLKILLSYLRRERWRSIGPQILQKRILSWPPDTDILRN